MALREKFKNVAATALVIGTGAIAGPPVVNEVLPATPDASLKASHFIANATTALSGSAYHVVVARDSVLNTSDKMLPVAQSLLREKGLKPLQQSRFLHKGGNSVGL